MATQLRSVKAFVEGSVFAEAVAALREKPKHDAVQMEYRNQDFGDRIELGEARQVHDHSELHARCRQRLLRLRSDQKKSRHRLEFPGAGLRKTRLVRADISCFMAVRSSGVSERIRAHPRRIAGGRQPGRSRWHRRISAGLPSPARADRAPGTRSARRLERRDIRALRAALYPRYRRMRQHAVAAELRRP